VVHAVAYPFIFFGQGGLRIVQRIDPQLEQDVGEQGHGGAGPGNEAQDFGAEGGGAPQQGHGGMGSGGAALRSQ